VLQSSLICIGYTLLSTSRLLTANSCNFAGVFLNIVSVNIPNGKLLDSARAATVPRIEKTKMQCEISVHHECERVIATVDVATWKHLDKVMKEVNRIYAAESIQTNLPAY